MPTDLSTITDPAKRAKEAAKIVRREQAAADRARRKRDVAAIVALRTGKARQVDLLAVCGVTRARFKTIMRAADASDEPLPDLKDPVGDALKATADLARRQGAADEAREVRNAAARAMLKPKAGYRPADVARATGLSTARVAQMGMSKG